MYGKTTAEPISPLNKGNLQQKNCFVQRKKGGIEQLNPNLLPEKGVHIHYTRVNFTHFQLRKNKLESHKKESPWDHIYLFFLYSSFLRTDWSFTNEYYLSLH